MKHIPNILTVFRILLIGLYVYLFMQEQYVLSIATYVVAFLSDVLDGFLARRNNWTSKLGKVLDPLADKLMLVAVLACFFISGYLKLWVLIVIVCVDLIQIVTGGILYLRKIVVYSEWFGKIATGLFAVAVVLTYCNILWNVAGWYQYVYVLAVAASIVAFVHYGINTLKKRYNP